MFEGFVLAVLMLQPIILGLVCYLFIEVRAMQKSTHSIQYVPVEPKFETMTDSVKEALTKDLFDNVN